MEELEGDNLSFTSVNPKVAAHLAKEHEKCRIDITLTGYFYRSFHNVEKRKYKALEQELNKLYGSTQGGVR